MSMKMETGVYHIQKGFAEKFSYALFSPAKVEEGKEYPLIVFLHGAGECGDDPIKSLCHPLPAMLVEGKEIDAFVLCPQCPVGYVWNFLTFELKEMIDSFVAKLPVDKSRISLTGLSMGGYGTWNMGIAFPDFFAALAPICGGGISWAVFRIADGKTPVWAFHGDADPVVPVRNSIEMCESLRARGGNVRLTLLHGVEHDSWNFAYRETRLVEWLLEQKR